MASSHRVEVAPPYDHAELTGYAARFVWADLRGRLAHKTLIGDAPKNRLY